MSNNKVNIGQRSSVDGTSAKYEDIGNEVAEWITVLYTYIYHLGNGIVSQGKIEAITFSVYKR